MIGLLLIINNAFAQWHYTITSQSFNSDCNSMGASLHVLAFEQAVEQWAVKTYSTQEECETARHNHGMINYSSGGCYARVTSTPCQGNAGSGSSTGGNQIGVYYGEPSLYDRLGKDGFVFSPTEKDINQNTYEELQMKMEAYNYSRNNAENKRSKTVGIRTGDNARDIKYDEDVKRKVELLSKNDNSNNYYTFVSRKEMNPNGQLNVKLFDAPILDEEYYRREVNYENLKNYLNASERLTDMYLANPQNLEYIIQKEYERVSGFNVTDILNKYPNSRTDEEWQILADYGAFKMNKIEQMMLDINKDIDRTAEKKELDAVILALDCYGNNTGGYLDNTNYKKINLDAFINSSDANPCLKELANTIQSCNNTEEAKGFHAELYYNELTNTYTIAFAGTDDFNDFINDARIGVNLLPLLEAKIPQYEEALSKIAKVINSIPDEERDSFNIEAVGHSLGGGLASIIGLETGIETKTFNAATVPNNFLKDKGLYDKVQEGDVQNIMAYHASSDILTVAQETFGSPAIGVSVDIGNSQPEPIKSPLEPSRDMDASKVSDLAYDIAQGTRNGIREHLIVNVVDTMTKNNNEKINSNPKLKTLNIAQKKLQFELNHIDYLKQGF